MLLSHPQSGELHYHQVVDGSRLACVYPRPSSYHFPKPWDFHECVDWFCAFTRAGWKSCFVVVISEVLCEDVKQLQEIPLPCHHSASRFPRVSPLMTSWEAHLTWPVCLRSLTIDKTVEVRMAPPLSLFKI